MNQEEKELLTRAMAICSRSEKAASDIRQNLTRWGLTDTGKQEKIIAWLRENNFIDERRYAKSYVRDKFRFNRWGKIKISGMLRAKGICDDIIREALESIPEEVYLETLRNDLLNKRKSVKASNQYDLRAKLMRFAQSRGYENDHIYKAIAEILK